MAWNTSLRCGVMTHLVRLIHQLNAVQWAVVDGHSDACSGKKHRFNILAF